ncbi:uncharacterized protein DS421_5g152340 [Arachis hypogaea]|nr:uncharacterized protein DS421_5g152340 [Arachis hypogaea]
MHQEAISTFKLQFDLKLELKRVRHSHSWATFFIPTFKLQFKVKLELKRVRRFCSSRVAFSFPRLSSSLTLNWSLNVFDQNCLQGCNLHFHV